MIALIVIGALLLIFVLLLFSSLTVELEYDNDLKYKVKYLCFTLAPKDEKKKKRKEEKEKRREAKKALKQKKKRDKLRKKKSNTQQKGQQTVNTGSGIKKPSPSEANSPKDKQPAPDIKKEKKPKPDIGLIIRIIQKAKPHVKRMFKKIRITKVYADITVGGDDAAKTAVSYGVHCAAVNGLIAFLDNTVTFKKEKINIRADFDLEKTDYYASGTIKLRVSTLLHSAIWGYMAVKDELAAIAGAASQDNVTQPKKAA